MWQMILQLFHMKLCWTDVEAYGWSAHSFCGHGKKYMTRYTHVKVVYCKAGRVGDVSLLCVIYFSSGFCTIWTKKQRKKKLSLHFPACPGVGYVRDVTISIYTATGRNFFLHCYIVSTGTKPGEKRRLFAKGATLWHQTNRTKRWGRRRSELRGLNPPRWGKKKG